MSPTKTEAVPFTSPFSERHRIQSARVVARVAFDTNRAQLMRLTEEHKQAGDTAFAEEKNIMLGVEGATERRDAAVEQMHGTEAAREQYQRSADAAHELISELDGELERLYDDEFDQFAKEAEAATLGCEREMRNVRKQTAHAAELWNLSASRWRALHKALHRRLEELNDREGRWPNTAGQTMVQPFPVNTDTLSLAPRPVGIDRLREAERGT